MTFPTTSAHVSPAFTDTFSSWHAISSQESLEKLQTDPEQGLTPEQISHRQQYFGPNELTETGGRSPLTILWEQFTNIMLVMLIAVAIISGILDLRQGKFPKDAIAIFAIVILNGLLGYLQESRAEQALAALKRLSSPKVKVVRQGIIQEIAAKELVPGDIMLLEAGVQIAADGRLLEAYNLQVRESALTGEAETINKQADLILGEESALGDRLNLVFQGTEVVQGRGTVLITQIGMDTELGRIATLIQSVEAEDTPLQQRMSQLGNVLVSSSLCLVVLVVVVGVLRSGWAYFEQLLEVSLSMAVAVVPEGLPAVVTVTLAIGTQRMVRRHALIRKLPAVETLGSVTTICSDKTGTLTQNKMVVQKVQTVSNSYEVTGEGYAPKGEIIPQDSDEYELNGELKQLLTACVLCNDALLQKPSEQWEILGDPTEGALLTLAGKVGLYREDLSLEMPRIAEIPFSSERKRMSVIIKTFAETEEELNTQGNGYQQTSGLFSSPYKMFTKGSPEIVLDRCTLIQQGDSVVTLTSEDRQRILAQNDQWASKGLRVLGFAGQNLPDLSDEDVGDHHENDLIWLGLVGMLDAPRKEVKGAVLRCREAGIRPIMITGDHQLTARAIATDLGIAQADDTILTGQELQHLNSAQLEQIVPEVSVYARVSPEHKLQIVKALQNRGEFVAMTGDGVNDAPALKQADIGIAMGITGTDVSKEASDAILLDDNFATIVAATEEGRVVYDNIRRFIKYILGSNIGEVLVIAAAPLIGLGGVPLSPLQILWMNLVTDGLPALALAMEPAEPNVMQRPPYSPRESIFSRGLGSYMVRIGIIFAILTIILMAWSYGYVKTPGLPGNPERWKTMVFTTLCLAQMGHALAVRSDSQLTIQLNPFSNPYVLAAVTFTSLLQILLVYVPPLQSFFGTHALSLNELLICVGFSALMFVWIELEKLVNRWFLNRQK
ncbi:calcium-translocating P-type ATPase, PMCA-type [Rippkaea orientalis PCC 8801]|uniref:Calcium-translocating P-type ATPase, PMCA-type n=1 Tax=Rippkaea orientalis (strain PCC 8801 / RF-1) TaxID=41431 RepID=B7K2E4_RIPO1|nr:cation-translocating P-type ATPase [Rippkaea orientalis]ACK65280.1 calcium-translocating P-type ATPase, PMCA-type [Rippkaea orientalis PCC 8801]